MHTIYTRGYIFNCLFLSLKTFSYFFVSKQIMHTSTRVCSCAAGGVVAEKVAGDATRGAGAGGGGGGGGGDCGGGMAVVLF